MIQKFSGIPVKARQRKYCTSKGITFFPKILHRDEPFHLNSPRNYRKFHSNGKRSGSAMVSVKFWRGNFRGRRPGTSAMRMLLRLTAVKLNPRPSGLGSSCLGFSVAWVPALQQYTLLVPRSTQVHKWVPAILMFLLSYYCRRKPERFSNRHCAKNTRLL